jgi:hypothetical protein
VLFGLITVGILLAPNLVLKINARKRDAEIERLASVREGLVTAMQCSQVVPNAAGWVTAAAGALGMDQTEVEQVFPDFPADTNIRRVLLIDPGIGASTLPFTQTVAGVSGPATNLLGASSRLMLVSNTKRSLTLPVTNGMPSLAAFDAIWNWVYNPSTKAPPAGWPASWNGYGEFLHVERINLASLFHKLTMTQLGYTLNDSSMSNVTSQVNVHTLRGAMLKVHSSDGVHRLSRVITKDALFDLSAYGSGNLPYLWYRFQQTSGAIATNSGTLGVPGNGRITNGLALGVAGPRPPAFPNFATNNYTADFDGNNDRVYTTNSILSNRRAFTLACWIYPDVNVANNRTGLIGQNDAVELGFITTSSIQIWSSSGGQVTLTYPYPIRQWHHIAAVGDGTSLRLYYDGGLAGSTSYTTANYGSSTYTFNVGGNGVFDPPGSSYLFNGKIDEVVFYTNALTATQIATLATGVIP